MCKKTTLVDWAFFADFPLGLVWVVRPSVRAVASLFVDRFERGWSRWIRNPPQVCHPGHFLTLFSSLSPYGYKLPYFWEKWEMCDNDPINQKILSREIVKMFCNSFEYFYQNIFIYNEINSKLLYFAGIIIYFDNTFRSFVMKSIMLYSK